MSTSKREKFKRFTKIFSGIDRVLFLFVFEDVIYAVLPILVLAGIDYLLKVA